MLGSVVSISDSSGREWNANGRWRLTTTQPESSQNTGPAFTENATSDNAESTTFSESMSSAEASLAKIFHTPDAGQALLESDQGCSLRPFAWFDNSDPEQLCWRTWQRSILGGWMSYSERWPESGMVVNGIAYPLPPLVPRISVNESSLWPTPRSADALRGPDYGATENHQGGGNLLGAVKSQRENSSGSLNPQWVEWLMGFPVGWTDLEGLGTL